MSARSLRAVPGSAAATDQASCPMPTQVRRGHTLTVTAQQGPPQTWKTCCIFHTCTYSLCFCAHGDEDVMYTMYSVCNYNSVCVFVTFKSEVGK